MSSNPTTFDFESAEKYKINVVRLGVVNGDVEFNYFYRDGYFDYR